MAERPALVNGHASDTDRHVSPAHETPVDSLQQPLENATLSSTDEAEIVPQEQVAEEEDDDQGVYEIESLCMNCHENGTTKLLLIKIPYFREVILESFECPHCGHKDSTIKSGDQIREKGSKFTLKLDEMSDLERQLIKSDSAIFFVDDLGLEMPSRSGQITNVEGILVQILQDMESGQAQRKRDDPALAARIQVVIDKLIEMMNGTRFPFQISLDDPAGNSWIAPAVNDTTHKYYQRDYVRTPEQNEKLGLGLQDDTDPDPFVDDIPKPEDEDEAPDPMADVNILSGQVYALDAHCPACARPCKVNAQMLSIPHFKEVIVMATVCDHCGYKSNEVKTGGAIPPKGSRITLHVKTLVDLSRDILKSQTCAVECPELDLNVNPGTMGGRFTTVEGLLTQVRDDLRGKMFGTGDEDMAPGDSMASTEKTKWDAFFATLDKALAAEIEFTLILEDPLASSYVQSLGDEKGEGDVDPQVTVEEYERTDEEEEELGLKDMKTEGYEADDADDEAAGGAETATEASSEL